MIQSGRPVYISHRENPEQPRLKYCSHCTVYFSLHNADYLGRNTYTVDKKGVPQDAKSVNLLVRLLDGQHDFNEPFNPRCGALVLIPEQ
jgi:hypothetical protein